MLDFTSCHPHLTPVLDQFPIVEGRATLRAWEHMLPKDFPSLETRLCHDALGSVSAEDEIIFPWPLDPKDIAQRR